MRNGPTTLNSTYVQLRFPVTQLVHLFEGFDGPSPILRERGSGEPIANHEMPVKSNNNKLRQTYSALRRKFRGNTISPEVSSVTDLSSVDRYRTPAGVCVSWCQGGGPRAESVRPLLEGRAYLITKSETTQCQDRIALLR